MLDDSSLETEKQLHYSTLGKVDSMSDFSFDLHKNRTAAASTLFEKPFLALCHTALLQTSSPAEKALAIRTIRDILGVALSDFDGKSLDIRLRSIIQNEMYSSPYYNEHFFTQDYEVRNILEHRALIELLATHDDKFILHLASRIWGTHASQETFQEFVLPKFKQRFCDDIGIMIDAGRLPLAIDFVNRVIDAIHVIVHEPSMLPEVTHADSALGVHIVDDKIIALSKQGFRDYHVYAHEMLHALSGETLVHKKARFHDTQWSTIENIRLGFRFNAGFDTRFNWLNEAMTETLTMQLTGDGADYAYRSERSLLTLLCKISGIDFSLFVDAYFEHFDPSKEGADRNPAWRKLYAALNRAFCPGFLLQLDKYIQANSIYDALDVIRKDWRGIY